MRIISRLTILAVIATLAALTALPQRIVSFDARFDKLVSHSAKIEKLTDGIGWAEGPLWDKKTRTLLFSDVVNNTIYRLHRDGMRTVFLKPSGYTGTEPFAGREPGSNGLAFDPQGDLVINRHGNREIVRFGKDGVTKVLVDRFEGRRINSPNDLVYSSDGDLYFTDPPFGLPKVLDDPGKELDFQGVYRLSKDGKLTVLTKEVRFPNGIAFSPDEKTLYISNADRASAVWYAFDVRGDGTLGQKREVFRLSDVPASKPGVPDGLKVDKHGYLFAAGPGGIHVVDPMDGKLLGSFEFDAATANCAWGEDGSVLYITSSSAVYRVRLNTRGAAF